MYSICKHSTNLLRYSWLSRYTKQSMVTMVQVLHCMVFIPLGNTTDGRLIQGVPPLRNNQILVISAKTYIGKILRNLSLFGRKELCCFHVGKSINQYGVNCTMALGLSDHKFGFDLHQNLRSVLRECILPVQCTFTVWILVLISLLFIWNGVFG